MEEQEMLALAKEVDELLERAERGEGILLDDHIEKFRKIHRYQIAKLLENALIIYEIAADTKALREGLT
jgi:hypothetical protein